MTDTTYAMCGDSWSYAVEMVNMLPAALQTHLQAKAAQGCQVIAFNVKSRGTAGNTYHIVYKTPA